MRVTVLPFFVLLGCRDLLNPPEGDGGPCPPEALTCGSCSFEDDRDDAAGILRVFRCATPDGEELDVVARESDDPGAAFDAHYYDPDTGLRVAAGRWYADPFESCGAEALAMWWGEDLTDCEAVCEHETHADTDPDLPTCG